YPHGLQGDDILLESRIVCVADVIEAMACHRPYRPAKGIKKALNEIEKHKGDFYDPDAVNACVRLFREKKFSFEEELLS
ncbi:MAG: two-component system response regulator, partial [Desulfobulbaceae bacterium]|nr:two-component system response regulator [Desulfobulbaceae bacterium]